MKSYTPKLKGDTCKVSAGGNKYNIGGKRVDEVVLRFDEDEQKFYARIVNPSQHTQYLFEQDRLGIMLTRGDVGRAMQTHHYDSFMDCDHKNLKSCGGHRVKRLYHPRWHGIRDSLVQIQNIDAEIELSCNCYEASPVHNSTWGSDLSYNYIKAILVSLHNSDFSTSRNCGYHRSYHTYCQRLLIQWDSDEWISLRHAGESQGLKKYRYDSISITQLDSKRYQITITNPNTALQQCIDNGYLYVGLIVNCLGKYNTGAGQHERKGDMNYNYPYEADYDKLSRNKRWNYRINATTYQPTSHFERMSSTTMIYTLPDTIHVPKHVWALGELVRKHHDSSMYVNVGVNYLSLSLRYGKGYLKYGCIGRLAINRIYRGYADKDGGFDGEGYTPILVV